MHINPWARVVISNCLTQVWPAVCIALKLCYWVPMGSWF